MICDALLSKLLIISIITAAIYLAPTREGLGIQGCIDASVTCVCFWYRGQKAAADRVVQVKQRRSQLLAFSTGGTVRRRRPCLRPDGEETNSREISE